MAGAIIEAGHLISRMKITDAKLRPISVINLQPFQQKYNVDMVAIHRASLQKLLAEKVGEKNIYLGKKLAFIQQIENGMVLQFEDGTEHQTTLVIGADGIHSQTRTYVTQHAMIRNANQPCWRGITDFELPKAQQHQLVEMWGRGKRFGFTHIAEGRVYWYALVSESHFKLDQSLAQTFNDLDPLVGQLIKSTPADQVIHSDLLDLQPINTWHNNNICLIGDAAHATTPNMGQGACQAIEDAWAISQCLAENELALAFAKFQKQRIAKATKVVNRSWQIGKIAHLENPMAIWLRNTAMRAMPKSMVTKQNEWIYKLGVDK